MNKLGSQYIHLRTKSAYSLLDGAMTVKKIAALAKERSLAALGICDINMFGAMEFSQGLKNNGIQPILGLDIKIHSFIGDNSAPECGNIALYAKNEFGLQNLMEISSASFLENIGENDLGLPFGRIAELSEGLIALSGGRAGPLVRAYKSSNEAAANHWVSLLNETFKDRLYIELQRHGHEDEDAAEEQIIDAAYRLSIPLVGTNDTRFDKRERHRSHEILRCIEEGALLSDDGRDRLTEEHYFKTNSEMLALFEDLPECIENTVEIAKRCAVNVEKRKPILPSFPSKDGLSESEELTAQARLGLKNRLEKRAPVAPIENYNERLEFEINVINKMGFSGYFLIVSDFIKWAKSKGIPVGPGRGSGAGSLVAYSLEITDLDPLEFGLLFERFLNPDRISMPDFDIDFCQERRDEVISYVQAKYGFDQVAQIITFGTLQPRAAVRDVGRVLGLGYGRVSDITKLIPNNPANPVKLADAIGQEAQLNELYRKDEDVKSVLDAALELEGLYRNASTHAAGLIIAGRPIRELVPLYKDPRSELPATQYNMKAAEDAGLVKFDFLGLKTLTVINYAIKLLAERDIIVDFSSQRYDDPEVFKFLATGNTLGVFQLEGQGMRDTLRRMVPTCLDDIIALISLYRPGPMENIPMYCDVKAGKQQADYLHPSLEPILRETHGVIIYQEQVMQIAQVLSGYSLGQADVLRRAMGKKDQAEMDRQRQGFVEGAKNNNVDSHTAGKIFDLVNKFAGYGFNKSHAAAYAVVSYQTAWLRAKYPVEFLTASMILDRQVTNKLSAYVQEAKRIGIKVVKPDINVSRANFSISDGTIVYGLGALKNIGLKAMEEMVRNREECGAFGNVHEFFERVGPKNLNKRSVETLIKAGGFDSIEKNRAKLFNAIDQLMAHANATNDDENSNQASLFGEDILPPRVPIVDCKPWAEQERLANEFAAVGLFLSGHPLDDMVEELTLRRTVFIANVEEYMQTSEAVFRMAGVIRASKERPAKKGGKFAWVTLTDPTGEFEVFVRPEELVNARDHCKVGNAVSFVANAKLIDGDLKISASRFDLVENIAQKEYDGVMVYLSDNPNFEDLANVTETLKGMESSNFGELKFVLRAQRGQEVELLVPGRYPLDISARRALKSAISVEAIQEY